MDEEQVTEWLETVIEAWEEDLIEPNAWEVNFLDSVKTQLEAGNELSENQIRVLEGMAQKAEKARS